MAKLKPWYQVVEPRDDLKENRPMDASEFAVHLDHVRERRQGVSPDYLDPTRFFHRTYFTGSLLDLSAQVVRRLSGIQVETSAVFNMATQFGGGKTHSLTTLYHLATTGEKAKAFKGVESILSRAGVSKVPKADTAVFVGAEFDVFKGRGGDGEPLRRTPWGEIAWQLGREKGFAAIAEHDAKGVAPAGDALRAMLPAGPGLVLMDELLNYVSRARKSGHRDQFFAFLQNLSEEARARNDFALCVSIPASEVTEMTPEDLTDYDSLKKLLDRLGKAIMMSADTEMAEVIRRRLFDWDGLPEDGRRTAATYADWAVEHAQELAGIDPDTAHERFKTAYPFHPSVLSVFERKWQSLPRFQKTRGVLRLLALWISHACQPKNWKGQRLITFDSAPFEDPIFRSALFEQLGSSDLEVPVTTDIAGKADAHAERLDREANDEVRKERMHRKAAAAIFFESNGGMTAAKAEATLPEVRLGVGGPDVNLANLDGVLEGLVGSCFYLNYGHNRYRFGLLPNLNQILVSRRGGVPAKEIEERIKKETEELFNQGPSPKELDRRFSVERSQDVPNRPMLTLAVLALDRTLNRKDTVPHMEAVVREHGGSGRTYKSAVIFAVPDSAEPVRDATREVLAWEAIKDDGETTERLDDSQRQLLQRNLKRAKADLKEALFRTYRHIALLDKENKLRLVDLGQITSSMAGSLAEVYLNHLTGTDDVTTKVGPARLEKYWPPALTEWSTKGARDAFYSSPQLPRLLNAEAIKRTIADGVTEGRLGYATRDSSGRLKLLKFGESLAEADVEVSDEYFLLKAEEAKKLLEPPRLASVTVQPGQVTLSPGEQAAFSCAGRDQYGQLFAIGSQTWTATGGSVTGDGLFTACEGPGGVYAVLVECEGVEGSAEVRVVAGKAGPPDDDGGGQKTPGVIRWQGEVPPQKWMNFYTKVLSRFGTTPGLRIMVSFEVPGDGAQAMAKADEARTGLKELGLNSNVITQ